MDNLDKTPISDIDSAIHAFFDVYFTNASEAIFITDINGRLIRANMSFARKFGVSEADAAGEIPAILRPDRDDDEFYHTVLRTLARKGNYKGEILGEHKNGEVCREWLSISSRKDDSGEATHYVGSVVDAADQMSQSLNRHYYDALTKLPNRLLLQDRLEFMINHARRNNEFMALLLLDIDRFKMINDTFGYEIGDMLLQVMADRLLTCVRDVDVVFRSGDDEFAVILEEIAQQEDAAKVAKRILNACSGPIQVNGQDVHVSVCMGISIFPTDGDGKVQILQNAETAMHRAREAGLSNYQHYKPGMNARALERLTLENDLRCALERGELRTFFQPQVEIKTGKIIGMEALIRWKHPELGMIPPIQFIPIAEDTGLILSIGEWVLRSSCEQAKKWQAEDRPLVISVNLSANQFHQQNLVHIVESALKDSGVPPNLLELEITESMSMKNPEETLNALAALKNIGVRIAIDDFGTGYSSLSYLKRFPIDTLKIDRSFLMDIPQNPRDAEIVKAIIAMALSLKLSIIAEGVENEQQAQYLLENGCKKMQGYLFSPPVPAPEFGKLLQSQRS
jgi:diguanylate cyclase (GGDEF)-like protein/PAS domain S-box-containing protein